MADHEYVPAEKKIVYLNRQMFATIVAMIPAGKLTTQEAIYEMWAKRKGGDSCELESYSILPIDKRVLWTPTDVQRVDFITDLKSYGSDNVESLIPYWRIISPNGTLIYSICGWTQCERYVKKFRFQICSHDS